MGLSAASVISRVGRAAIWRWCTRLGFAGLDQALVSGANFAVSLALARWLTPEEFGAFAVGFSLFLVASGFQNALILEPMSVIGVDYWASDPRGYLRSVLRLNAVVTALLGAVLLVGIVLPVGDGQRRALAGAAVATVLVLLFWTVRRSFYIETRPERAALASASYAAGVVAAVVGLRLAGALSAFTGLCAMGVGSIAGAALGYGLLVATGGARRSEDRNDVGLRAVAAAHWRYGRWITVAAVLANANTQAQTLLTAGMIGLEGAGALRAVTLFMMPVAQSVTALGTLALPVLSRAYLDGGLASLLDRSRRVTGLLVAPAVAYVLVLAVVAAPLEHVVYGGKFAAYAWLIPLAALLPVFTALASGYTLSLRAAQRPEHFAIACAVTLPVSIGSAVAFTWAWGVAGAVASSVATAVASAAVVYALYRLWLR